MNINDNNKNIEIGSIQLIQKSIIIRIIHYDIDKECLLTIINNKIIQKEILNFFINHFEFNQNNNNNNNNYLQMLYHFKYPINLFEINKKKRNNNSNNYYVGLIELNDDSHMINNNNNNMLV